MGTRPADVGQADFAAAKAVCDVVMKGGITSGVVYPLAIVELAKKYRLRCIGGTSAGALAAAITAAAELDRGGGGFVRVAAIPGEIAETLFDKFQPDPALRPLFGILVAALERDGLGRAIGMLRAAVSGYWVAMLAGAAFGLVVAALALAAVDVGWLVAGLVLAVVGAAAGLAARLVHALRRELPAADYGLCSGRTQPGGSGPGLTDWLADTIDRVAGRPAGPADPPLAFGDLNGAGGHEIELAMVTTDLAGKRPYRLPFRAWERRAHAFSPREFRALFPDRVVDAMVAHSAAVDAGWRPAGDLRTFPDAAHLPLVVAARMSLSFPGLIKAVPLYKRDFTLRDEGARQVPRRCLFSDGGLSSNFPIHFFDRLWPGSPTFAFALDAYSEDRQVADRDAPAPGGNRIFMADDAGDGILVPLQPIDGLGGFLMRLLDSAKDWQDTLQSTLPGYRERIVRIALAAEEGGLNLKMRPATIAALSGYGRLAGETAAAGFDFDEHRWRRFLVAMARLEATFDGLAETYDAGKAGGESFGAFLARYQRPRSYPPVSAAWKTEILARAEQIAGLGRAWREAPVVRDGRIPLPECDMRITPKL